MHFYDNYIIEQQLIPGEVLVFFRKKIIFFLDLHRKILLLICKAKELSRSPKTFTVRERSRCDQFMVIKYDRKGSPNHCIGLHVIFHGKIILPRFVI